MWHWSLQIAFIHFNRSQFVGLNQYLFASYLAVLNDSRSWGMNSQHGVVVVGIVLCVCLICCHNGCGQTKRQRSIFSPAQLIKLIKKPKRGALRAVWRVGNFKHSKGSAVITQGRALGTLNVLNSKWTMAMNFIKKIPFHFKFEGCHV